MKQRRNSTYAVLLVIKKFFLNTEEFEMPGKHNAKEDPFFTPPTVVRIQARFFKEVLPGAIIFCHFYNSLRVLMSDKFGKGSDVRMAAARCLSCCRMMVNC